ncbi:heat shock protein 70 family, partial [Rhizoctonia solani]
MNTILILFDLLCLAIGISIDNHDRFTVAISGDDMLFHGSFEVGESFSVNVNLSGSPTSHLKTGLFWSTLTAEGTDVLKLANTVFAALKNSSDTLSSSFSSCVIASPLALSSSQKDLVASVSKEVFGCVDDSLVIREYAAIIYALDIDSSEIEDVSIVLLAPNEFTYILGEDYSTTVVIDTFPPPLDLDLVVSKYDVKEIIVVRDPGEPELGQTYGANKIPIRYESDDIIARGALIVAENALPVPPVSLLSLPLGVALHGAISHPVIPMFAVLPQHVKLNLTTVHDNQRAALIELWEGPRARATDNLFLTKLRLEDIPPAPAGTVLIEVTISVEDYPNRVRVEAVEAISGKKASTLVQRDEPVYAEGVLDEYQAAKERFAEEDAKLRENWNKNLPHQTQVWSL